MAFEVVCTECDGRLRVEQTGVVVACPHCDAHLTIDSDVLETPAKTPAGADAGDAPLSSVIRRLEELTTDDSVGTSADSQIDPSAFADVASDDPAPAWFAPEPGGSSIAPAASPADVFNSAAIDPQAPTILSPPEQAAGVDDPTVSMFPEAEADNRPEVEATEVMQRPEDEDDQSSKPAASDPPPNARGAATRRPRGRETETVSKTLFFAVASYASAVTLACLFLLWQLSRIDEHQLESLPDKVPAMKDNKIAFQLIPEGASMPPHHTLSLGREPVRFGNLEVSAVKVTREPLEFEYYNGEVPPSDRTPPPATDPVLKLWLEFKNVGKNQIIPPFDVPKGPDGEERSLLYLRVTSAKDPDQVRANNFVAPLDRKEQAGSRVFVYPLNLDDWWELKGQDRLRSLRPGESYTTYVPTDTENLDELDGKLVWRVQFRKGFNPESMRGVTTLIEVVFDSSDVQPG